jgi:1-acyl-sn-glycerol-3-phosphate acyltransferase
MDRFRHRFRPVGFKPEAMMPVYGMAESSVALALPPLLRGPRIASLAREPFETEGRAVAAAEGDIRSLQFVSVGRPLKGHEVRIVGDEGQLLPEGREGVLQFRGPSTMQGYYRNPEATSAVFDPGGWTDSGDRAFMENGEIYITGRVKDIVIRAGRNIYPHEAEEIVADVEGVRRGCVAAFGVPDERQGTEKLIIVVETRVDESSRHQSMTAAIQERLGELFGAPADDVVLVPPGTVPKTSSGKLRRSATKERYIDGKLLGATDRRRSLLLKVAFLDVLERLKRTAGRLGRWIYGTYALLLALVCIVPSWFLTFAVPSRRIARRLVQFGARTYLFLSGCRFSVEGLGHLKSSSEAPVVFVSNHASYLDPLPILAGLPLDYAFIVKREAGRWPVIGTFIHRLDHLLVDRVDPRQSVESAEQVATALRQGRSMFFFAEGTFTRATGLRPFKLGAFKLAAETGHPIVPVALKGTRRWLRDGTWLPRRSDVQLVIDEPLQPLSSSLSEVVRLRNEAAETIARHVGEPRLDLVVAGAPVGGES